MDVTDWSDAQIENMINGIYDGDISPARLPVDVYEEIHKRLFSGVVSGFGGSVVDFPEGSTNRDLLEHFNHNVAIFSGAKTHQQVNDMTKEVFKDGMKQSFADFKSAATKIFDTYNKDWLKTEFNMAHQQALSGRKWNDIQSNKDIFPKLKYVTTGDGRVRPDHVKLDGIVRPVDDPFWKRYYPPNDWGCRCGIEQITETELANTPEHEIKSIEYVPLPLFDGNAGIDKVIFNEGHPYFTVSQKYELLKSTNFNLPTPALPVPEKIESTDLATTKQSMKTLTGLDDSIVNERIWKHVSPNLSFSDSENYPNKSYRNRSFYLSSEKRIYLGVKNDKRWQGFQMEKVVIHEIGHDVHYRLRQIDAFNMSDRAVQFKDDLKKSFKKMFPVQKYGAAEIPFEKSARFWTHTFEDQHRSFFAVAEKYLLEQGVNKNDASEMSCVLFDIIGGITKGDLGGGHDVSYYKKGNGGMKEVFANFFQIVNATDPRARMVVEKFWPEGLKIAEEYFNEILK